MNTEKKENPICALYPLTKLYLAAVLIAAAVLFPALPARIACFACIHVLAWASGCYRAVVKRWAGTLGILFLIILVVQTLFYPGEQVLFQIWIFEAKRESLMLALKLGILLLDVGGSLIWFFAITSEKALVTALHKAGMSTDMTYILLSTLQMVPVLKQKSAVIMNAQKARGLETEGNVLVRARAFLPVLVPLVLSSIQGTEERALALEARGFSVEGKKTHLFDIRPGKADRAAAVLLTVLLLCMIAGRVALWMA